jgi:hypothetical protein
MFNQGYGTSFHGTKATLVVNRGGYWLYPAAKGAEPVAETSPALREMNVRHWKNWVECIRTRQKPVAEIETCVRTTVTCLLANIALRFNLRLDWDDKAFTVLQPEAKQYLKAVYRAPWKLEV